MTYYTQNTGHGSLNISELVFIQSAQRVLQELSVGQLKDRILLKSGKKTCKVTCEIDKHNKIVVSAEIFMVAGDENASEATSLIQQSIYDAIYDITEIRQVKINVLVLGFVLKN